MDELLDITQLPAVLRSINAVINNGGTAEVKVERWKSGKKITVVEQTRSVKCVYPPES